MTEMPTWEEFMIPTLRVLSDGQVRTRRDLCPRVARDVQLTDEQTKEVLASGQYLYENRIGWGLSFLTNVGALARPTRGNYTITDAGRQVLERFPGGVREHELRALGEDPNSPIRAYEATAPRAAPPSSPLSPESSSMTPTEQVQGGVARIHEEVASELLLRLQGKDPGFFEEAVVQLLLAMGYGGTTGSGSVTQLSNDGGIDGVIDQDVLGLSRVYIQAKRYGNDNVVQRPDVQGFVGALSGKADSGVFITTSRFSEGARTYADSVPTRIILIDGKRLADLMIRYGVGVQVRETYSIVEIDEDFFA
ncbi:restriction endonuclease [Microbacterium thalassium]|uniref:Restriction system protein n=1 Tax=Microbacterium thalassium TaxID=362649 RepID=A0A7X0FMH6_9MICO|nr:restriction endonuclease [Microbacterium thalassium]MBB6390186.1 restriction system protein [Microbacterium thalassium]GLK25294.1 restriction endonuclease [Microbacterium thalassium]